MTTKTPPPHDEVIALYHEGYSPATIAGRYGYTGQSIRRILKRNGIKLRNLQESAVAAWAVGTQPKRDMRVHRQLPEGVIVARYLDGLPEFKLAAEYGVSRPVILRILREHGVERRGPNECHKHYLASSTAEMRARQTAAANVACRGRTVPWVEKCNRAIANEAKGLLTELEARFYKALEARGVHATPQVACGAYNFDLALPRAKVAMEVQNTWHHSDRKRKQDAKKASHAISEGWIVFYVYEKDLDGMLFDVLCSNLKLIATSREMQHSNN